MENIVHNLHLTTLEFAIQAWSLYLIGDINRLQQVQHRATKLVTSIKHKPYEEILSILGITTLANRRVRSDLIQQFKITNGLDLIDFTLSQKPASDAYAISGDKINVKCRKSCLLWPKKILLYKYDA